MKHYSIKYSGTVNDILHDVLISTWNYKHEILEIPGLVTALLITYDNQRQDEFIVKSDLTWEKFLNRMSRVKPDWAFFSIENMRGMAEQPHKTMGGWEGRTIYIIKGGSKPEFWTREKAREDINLLISSTTRIHAPLIQHELESAKEQIPPGRKFFRVYEDLVRVTINCLFREHLGEAKFQKRTEAGDYGVEVRDIICQNNSNYGYWKDQKDKYSCSEIIFDAKNKIELSRNDLRQIYCYLKPAIGLWGYIVCRTDQPSKIHAYNRTLYNNFSQKRGVLIISDFDLERMVEIRLRDRDPSDYMREKMSEFITSV